MPDLSFEAKHRAQGLKSLGVDEVGRGCLAGPVVAAAVLLPDSLWDDSGGLDSNFKDSFWSELNDSKLLSSVKREKFAKLISENAFIQIAWCYPEEIDRYNILHASMIAMRRALAPFSGLASVVLVDGHLSPYSEKLSCPPGEAERLKFTVIEPIVKGDQRSISIAAASIVAKVYRDQWMVSFDEVFPQYEFGKHKGYSTPVHYRAIEAHGPCAIHRLSFAPFKNSAK